MIVTTACHTCERNHLMFPLRQAISIHGLSYGSIQTQQRIMDKINL